MLDKKDLRENRNFKDEDNTTLILQYVGIVIVVAVISYYVFR